MRPWLSPRARAAPYGYNRIPAQIKRRWVLRGDPKPRRSIHRCVPSATARGHFRRRRWTSTSLAAAGRLSHRCGARRARSRCSSAAADSTQPPCGVAEGNGRRNDGKKEPGRRPRTPRRAANQSLDERAAVTAADTYIAWHLYITGNQSELSCW